MNEFRTDREGLGITETDFVFSKPVEFKKENPYRIMGLLKRVRDLFRKKISEETDDKKREKIETEFKTELAKIEEQDTRNGVNFSRCQMVDVINDYQKGKPVEFEALGPYIMDYNLKTGEIKPENLTKTDIVGLEISRLLRQKFPKARLISLCDEYNTGILDSTNFRGIPTEKIISDPSIKGFVPKKKGYEDDEPKVTPPNATQLTLPDETKTNFRKNYEQLLKNQGIIRDDDKDGKDYLLVSESAKTQEADELVRRLEKLEKINRIDQAIYFINPKAENALYQKIKLKDENGQWTCTALDAASFLGKDNSKITHLIILPNDFIKQQDQVWEILRVLDIQPANYHNIFYDENTPPEQVVETIREEIEKYLK
ncbi:MAG TPA: hypothetical protein DEB09_04965 [Candidatus Magasanikbacteria bacterium]|nr:hypothetical protein [Candidatus Magasanikbacteria bacterium]